MVKTIRKYTNFDDMKADEYRYWQGRIGRAARSMSVSPRFPNSPKNTMH